MKTTLILFSGWLAAGTVFAGSEQIIKQRAKELSNQNDVRQGVTPPSQAGPQAPATPVPLTIEQQSLNRFRADLAAIKAEEPVTPEKKQQLARDLIGAALAPKPSPEAAKKLAEDLSAAFSQKPLTAESRARFVQEIDAVLNPSKYPQAKMPAIFDDIQAIFQTSGLTRKDAVQLVEDVKGLSAAGQTAGTK
jgi:hypothetical protein